MWQPFFSRAIPTYGVLPYSMIILRLSHPKHTFWGIPCLHCILVASRTIKRSPSASQQHVQLNIQLKSRKKDTCKNSNGAYNNYVQEVMLSDTIKTCCMQSRLRHHLKTKWLCYNTQTKVLNYVVSVAVN